MELHLDLLNGLSDGVINNMINSCLPREITENGSLQQRNLFWAGTLTAIEEFWNHQDTQLITKQDGIEELVIMKIPGFLLEITIRMLSMEKHPLLEITILSITTKEQECLSETLQVIQTFLVWVQILLLKKPVANGHQEKKSWFRVMHIAQTVAKFWIDLDQAIPLMNAISSAKTYQIVLTLFGEVPGVILSKQVAQEKPYRVMETFTNCQTRLSQKYLVSTFVQLLKLQEPLQKSNAKLKIKINAFVTKPCQEIEKEITEAANQRHEEVTHAKNGQVKVLMLILGE